MRTTADGAGVRKLALVLACLILFYVLVFIWPTRWRYSHLGSTPVRWDRVTGQMQFCSFHGWTDQLPPIGGK